MQQTQYFIAFGTFVHRDQFVFPGHYGRNRCIEAGFKARITIRNNTDQFALIHHRHTGNILRPG